MGLGDVVYDIGNVSTSKEVGDLSFDEDTLKRLLYYQPQWLPSFCYNMDEDDCMKLVELADDVIQNGPPHEKASEQNIEELKMYREEAVQECLVD